MNIESYFAGSCATAAIKDLGSHKNALDAMKQFCQNSLGTLDDSWRTTYGKLEPFYIFVAGPEVPSNHPNGSHHSKDWVKYGTEFAQYIEENELGLITTLPAKFNLKHHKNTTCQVWLWSPEQVGLEAHWEKLQNKKKTKKGEI